MTGYYIELGEAKSVLKSRMPVFAGALRKALHEWNKGLGAYHATVDEFARGVLINQFWYVFSSHALRDDTGISLEKHGNGYFFTVDDSLVLRLKHVNKAYRSWNHPTRRSLALDAQVPFPTIPPMARLELGYRLDLTGTVVEDAVVMLNNNGRSLWRWQIWGYPISEFAASPSDMLGHAVYSHDDFSGVLLA